MNFSCNFTNWMNAATRQRACSVTPTASSNSIRNTKSNDASECKTMSAISNNSGRRASSSEDIIQSQSQLLPSLNNSHRSASGNHLALNSSVETICPSSNDFTQTGNKTSQCYNDDEHVLQLLDSPHLESLSLDEPSSLTSQHPIPLDDNFIYDEEFDCSELEEKCRKLEAEAEELENKVAELEKRRFAPDVPRTLVDNIIHHRKELRDLSVQLYKHNLDSEESDKQSCGRLSQLNDELSPPSCEEILGNFYPLAGLDSDMTTDGEDDFVDRYPHISEYNIHPRAVAAAVAAPLNTNSPRRGRVGSQLKPGQENTADILNAIPPSGHLQHKQYLSKASTGTTNANNYSQFSDIYQLRRYRQQQATNRYAPVPSEYETEDSNSASSNVRNLPQNHYQKQQHHHHQTSRHHQTYQSREQQRHHLSQQQQHISAQRRQLLHSMPVSSSLQQQQQPQQRQVVVKVDFASEKMATLSLRGASSVASHHNLRSSPVRPTHFNTDFGSAQVVIAQDSSSTTSSSSPH